MILLGACSDPDFWNLPHWSAIVAVVHAHEPMLKKASFVRAFLSMPTKSFKKLLSSSFHIQAQLKEFA